MEKHVYLTFKEVYDILHRLMPNNNDHWCTLSNILGIKISKDPFFKLYNLKTLRMNLDAKLPDGFDANLYSQNLSKLLVNKKEEDITNAYISLQALIRDAENIGDKQKQNWLNTKTYPTFEKLFCNVIYKLMQDGKTYHTSEVIAYYDQLPKTTQSSEDKLNIFLNQLLLISEHNYNSIEDADQRFHASSIDIDLLSFGAYVDNTGTAITDLLSTSFKGCDNNLVIEGDGGIGKTTFLVNTFKHNKPIHSSRKWEYQTYIPFYISLAALKHLDHDADISTLQHSLILDAITERATTMFQHGLFENYKYDEKVFQKQLREYISNCSNKLKVLLLLDGFNEISLSNEGILRDKIASDIENLSTYANVRIVVTSRTIPQSKHLQLANKLHITATGIPKDKITSILTKNNIINVSDKKLLNILQNPLFLQMFISTYSSAAPVANSRGSILYNYYNRPVSENRNYYSETLIHDYINKKLDSTAPSYMPIVMDFILPAIAFQMVMDDTHEITINQCFDIIDNLELLVRPFENERSKFAHYNKALNRIIKYVKETPDSADIIKEILYRVNVLYQPENLSHTECFSFTHHFIRDYFASIFMLNAYLIAPIKLSDYTYYNKLHSFSIDLTLNLLMSEILHAESAYGNELSLLEYAKLSSARSAHTLSVNNTMTLLSVYMNRDFSSLHFDGIDLSQYCLYDINCHNPETGTNTAFEKCTISSQSLNKVTDNYYHMTRELFINQKLCSFDFYASDNICKLFVKDLSTQTIISSYIIDTDSETFICNGIPFHNFKISDNGEYLTLIYINKNILHIVSIKLTTELEVLEPSFNHTYALKNSSQKYRFEYLTADTAVIMFPGDKIELLNLNTNSVSNLMSFDLDLIKNYKDSDFEHFTVKKINSKQIVAGFSFKEYPFNSKDSLYDHILHEFLYLINIEEKTIKDITPNECVLLHVDEYILPIDCTQKGIFINYKDQLLQYDFSTSQWTNIPISIFKNYSTETLNSIPLSFECICNNNNKLYLFHSTTVTVYDLDKNEVINQEHHKIPTPFSIVLHNEKYILFDARNEYYYTLNTDSFEYNIYPRTALSTIQSLFNDESLISLCTNGSIYKLDKSILCVTASYTEYIDHEILQSTHSPDAHTIAFITGDSYTKKDYILYVYDLKNDIKKIFSSSLEAEACICFSETGDALYILTHKELNILFLPCAEKNKKTFDLCINLENMDLKIDSIIGIDPYKPVFFIHSYEAKHHDIFSFEIIHKKNDYGICYYKLPDDFYFFHIQDTTLRQTCNASIIEVSSSNNSSFKIMYPILKEFIWYGSSHKEKKLVYETNNLYAYALVHYIGEYIIHPDYPYIRHTPSGFGSSHIIVYDSNNPDEKIITKINSHSNVLCEYTRAFGTVNGQYIFNESLMGGRRIVSNISLGINISNCKFINCTYTDDCCYEIITNMHGIIIE